MNTEQIEIEKFTFVKGEGNFSEKTACIISACVAKWRMEHGEPLGTATDEIKCVCPVIRRYAIRINDSALFATDAERTEMLMPFVDKLLDTKGSRDLMQRRAYLCADYAVRKFAPTALRARGYAEHAEKLESLEPAVDREGARVARDAARAYAAGAAAGETRIKLRDLALELLAKLCEMREP